MKILKELITGNNWLGVELTISALYPDQKELIDEYERIYKALEIMIPKKSDIAIVLERIGDKEVEYIDVSGKEKNVNESDENLRTDSLALEFTPWSEWLGMQIEHNTLAAFTELEILAHCLYEMTFIDFNEEEIGKEFKKIEKTVDEIKSMTKAGKEENTIPWEKQGNRHKSNE